MVRKRRDTLARREQIINAARKVIIKHGSEHVTVRRIAKEVGISEGAIYRHFKNKGEVLFLLADHIEANLLADIEPEAGVGGYSSLETLDRVLKSHLSAIEQRHGISFQVIAEIVSLGDRKLNRKIFDIISKYTNRLKSLLSQGIKAGEIREDADPEAMALILFGTIQGLVNTWYLSNYSFDPQVMYAHLWKNLHNVLAKRPA